MLCSVAKDVVYQDSHEWAKVDGETATVGISDFAQVQIVYKLCSARDCPEFQQSGRFSDHFGVVQAELGDIVYVELPEVGAEVKQGEQFGVIESVKVSASGQLQDLACDDFCWLQL